MNRQIVNDAWNVAGALRSKEQRQLAVGLASNLRAMGLVSTLRWLEVKPEGETLARHVRRYAGLSERGREVFAADASNVDQLRALGRAFALADALHHVIKVVEKPGIRAPRGEPEFDGPARPKGQGVMGKTAHDLADSEGKNAQNPALLLTRYAPHLKEKSGENSKAERFIRETFANIALPDAYRAGFERWQRATLPDGRFRRVLRFKTEAPVLCGLGETTPLENGLALHPTYGTPILPGSALKGVARAFARERLGGDWSNGGQADQLLFGAAAEDAGAKTEGGESLGVGCVDFLDGWIEPDAEHGKPFRADVLTPHHKDYYQGNAAPKGFENPIPVHFLAVEGTFRVVLEGDPEWVETAAEILDLALKEHGIGAKTRAGYGVLTQYPMKEVDLEAKKHAENRLIREGDPEEQLRQLTEKYGGDEDRLLQSLKNWFDQKKPQIEAVGYLRHDHPETGHAVAHWLQERGHLAKWKTGSKKEKAIYRTCRGWLQAARNEAGTREPRGDRPPTGTGSPAPKAPPPEDTARAFGEKVLAKESLPKFSKKANKLRKERNRFAERIAKGRYTRESVERALEHLRSYDAKPGTLDIVLKAYNMDEPSTTGSSSSNKGSAP